MEGHKTIQFFHTDADKILEMNQMSADDFASATPDEKESMVQMHKSVSYWRDAWRRFRRNHVSMGALGVFILILIFSFIGPYFIPYSYEDQYRSAQKLGPMQYSETEQLVQNLMKEGADGFYATSLKSGSLTAIKKGDWYFTAGGETYAFSLDKGIERATLVFDADAETPVYVGYDRDYDEETGTFAEVTPIETTNTPAEGAQELKLDKSVFPHVFGTDSQGRDLMARCM